MTEDGSWKQLLIPKHHMAILPGYTLERATCGVVTAVTHRVVIVLLLLHTLHTKHLLCPAVSTIANCMSHVHAATNINRATSNISLRSHVLYCSPFSCACTLTVCAVHDLQTIATPLAQQMATLYAAYAAIASVRTSIACLAACIVAGYATTESKLVLC